MTQAMQRERLVELVAADPAEPGFPALAESFRREGRVADAERVLRNGLEVADASEIGWTVLCLTLLDQGRYDEARELLAQRAERSYSAYFGTHPFQQEISLGELDRAFERAEPEQEELVDADRVAQHAMRAAALDSPEELPAARPSTAYATETMAALLARQGDDEAAAQIRERLAARKPQAAAREPSGSPRRRSAATLERWLHNLRALA